MKGHLLKYSLVLWLMIISHGIVYAHQPAHIRAVPDSVTDKLQKEKAFLYANDSSYWTEEQQDNSLIKLLNAIARSPALKWTLYIFLALIVLFIIYQVAVANNFFMFSRSSRKKKKKSGDEAEESENDDLDRKIDEAINAGEYRIATRFLFLRTLKMLQEKNRIQLHARATNNDYILQMRKHPASGEFNMLTRIYEYVWYGEFVPENHQFDMIKNNFDHFDARA